MNNITLRTIDNYFILEVQSSLPELHIAKHNKTNPINFEHYESRNYYQIAVDKIASILDPEIEDRAFIFYSQDGAVSEINLNDFEMKIAGKLSIEYENKLIYLYLSLDGKLRFMWNQKPSAKCFYSSNSTQKIYEHNNKMIIKQTIVTQLLPVKSAEFILKNRKNAKEIRTSIAPSKINSLGNSIFENIFYIEFIPSNQIPIITTELNLETYDTNVFDLWFTLNFDALPVTDFKFRIPYNDNLSDETWFNFNDDYMMAMISYSTQGYHNLSFRVTYFPKHSYKKYMQLDSIQTIPHEKKVILVSEYPQKAQDNGLIFFKYLVDNHLNDFDPYYIISKESKDIGNLENYMKRVIYYKSPQHLEAFMRCSYIAHTHSSNYSLPLYTKKMIEKKKHIKKVFLQHGVIGVRNLRYIYGKEQQPDFTNHFIVSSKREKDIVIKELKYNKNEVSISGLPRFDNLLKRNNKLFSFLKRKKVLIMPSWRMNQDRLSDDEFKTTDFYYYIQQLINDNSFKKIAKENHLQINLYLHANFQKYNRLFHSEFVNVIPEGSITVQDLMKSHGILITDYSSVGLDFALLKRPVLYYQFDTSLSEGRDVNLANFLPGPIFNNKEELILELKKKVRNNNIDKKYRGHIRKNIYQYDDSQANKRIFQVLEKL